MPFPLQANVTKNLGCCPLDVKDKPERSTTRDPVIGMEVNPEMGDPFSVVTVRTAEV